MLEDGEVRRRKVSRRVDMRIVAATNRRQRRDNIGITGCSTYGRQTLAPRRTKSPAHTPNPLQAQASREFINTLVSSRAVRFVTKPVDRGAASGPKRPFRCNASRPLSFDTYAQMCI